LTTEPEEKFSVSQTEPAQLIDGYPTPEKEIDIIDGPNIVWSSMDQVAVDG
jgi:hypothetical protein